MVTWLKHRICGYLLVSLTGYSPERFFNLCSAHGIEIWGISYTGHAYRFYMTVRGFRRIRPLVRKAKVRLRIVKKFGLPFFLYRNRKRKLYFAGLLTFFVLLYTMSLFVWDIEFTGNYRYTYDTLIHYFATQNIGYGMRKSRVDCDEIEASLRTQFPEITWVSAQVSGTRLLVKIKENEVLSSIPAKDEAPCDLVAERAGKITRMVVRTGVPLVKIGDQVEAGQVLVSGILPVTDDSETVVNTHYVHSDADIEARTEYEYSKTCPMFHEVAVETGKERNGISFKVLDKSLVLLRKKPENTTWKLFNDQRQLKLFQNFYLPVFVGKIKAKEYITYERAYTQQELQQLGDTIQESFQKKLLEKGVQIIENHVKILDNGTECKITGHFLVEQSIVRQQAIQQPEETNIADERSGDNH